MSLFARQDRALADLDRATRRWAALTTARGATITRRVQATNRAGQPVEVVMTLQLNDPAETTDGR